MINLYIALMFLLTGWVGYLCGEREIAITAAIMSFLAIAVHVINEKTQKK